MKRPTTRHPRALFPIALLVALPLLCTAALANDPPRVVTVPFEPTELTQAHPAWPGLSVVLKGTAHDPDGDSDLSQYRWDWGDGSGDSGWIGVGNPYVIEASHTYACASDDRYVAVLEVCDTGSACGDDTYLIECVDPDFRSPDGYLVNRINRSIDEGLWYLHKTMNRFTTGDGAPAGTWSDFGDTPATTASAVEAFEGKNAYPEPRGNRDENPYVEDVERGINYLLTTLNPVGITATQNCPTDLNDNGIGLGNTDYPYPYQDGIVLQALVTSQVPDNVAATGDPTWVKDRTLLDIATDVADLLVYGQNESGSGRGGWRYGHNYSSSDNSATQWPILGLGAAEFFFGIPVPACTKDELGIWLDYSQCSDGGYGYTSPNNWCNMNKTGAGLAGLALINRPDDHTDWEAAENFVCNYWPPYGYWGDCDFQEMYAWYAVMKAVVLQQRNMSELTGTNYEINCFCPDSTDSDSCLPGHSGTGKNWYQTYSDHLIAVQGSPGYWSQQCWTGTYISTSWAILILEKAVTCHFPVADAGARLDNVAPGEEIVLDGCQSLAPSKYDPDDPDFEISAYNWDFDATDEDPSSGQDGTCAGNDCLDDAWHECHVCVEGEPCECTATFAAPIYYVGGDPESGIDWDATAGCYEISLCIETDNVEGCPTGDNDRTEICVTEPPYAPLADMPSDVGIGCADCIVLDVSNSFHPAYNLFCAVDPDHPFCDWIVSRKFDLDGDGEFDDGYCEDRDDPPDDAYDWCYWDTDGDGVMDRDARHIEWCNCDFNDCEKDQSIVRLEVCDAKASPDPTIDDCDYSDMFVDASGQDPLCSGFVNEAGASVEFYSCDDQTGVHLEGVAEERCPGEILEYRWDYDCDGTWDGQWESVPFDNYAYPDCDSDRNACFQARVTDAPALQCQASIAVVQCLPPIAVGGAVPAADCHEAGLKAVLLNGTLSSDPNPDGGIVEYAWSEGGTPIGSGATALVSLSLGPHIVDLCVTNECGLVHCVGLEMNLLDTAPPTLSTTTDSGKCDNTLEPWYDVRAVCSDACGAATCTNDRTGGGCDASGFYPVGDTAVTFACTDAAGISTGESATVRVADGDGDDIANLCDGIGLTTATSHFLPGPVHLFHQNCYSMHETTSAITLLANFLPWHIGLDALDEMPNGQVLFSVKPGGTVPNGGGTLQLHENRIYRFNGLFITEELDPFDIGINLRTLNALDRLDDGSYLISVNRLQFVRHVLGWSIVKPAHVYRMTPGGALVLVYNFALKGFSDIDGVDGLPDGRIAVSARADGFTYNPDLYHHRNMNVYIYDPGTDELVLSFDGGSHEFNNLDGFTLIPVE